MCVSRPTISCLNILFLLFHLSFAQNPDDQRCKNPLSSCDPSQSLFPDEDRITIVYANSTIPKVSYSNIYVDFTVSFTYPLDTTSSTLELEYRLVPCGCAPPNDTPDDTIVIYTNPTDVLVEETPALYMINQSLSSLDHVRYVSNLNNIYNPAVHELANTDPPAIVQAYSSEDYSLDYPLLTSEKRVSLYFKSTLNFVKARDEFQEKVGRPVLPVAEANEVSPLARAEWVKLIALIFNQTKRANDIFDDIVDVYNDAKVQAMSATRRPSVFFNYPYIKDDGYVWSQPGSKQYVSELIRDANADYRLAYSGNEDSSNDLRISEILEQFGSARILLNSDPYPFLKVPTIESYIGNVKDANSTAGNMMEMLDAVQCGQVWGNTKRRSENLTASDFYESSIARPDIILLDYIKILHPDINIGDHQLYYMFRYTAETEQNYKCPYTSLIDKPAEGEVYVDKDLIIQGMNRFEVQDRLVDGVYPKLEEKNITKETIDVQFRNAQSADEEKADLTVRILVKEEDAEETLNSPDVVNAFDEALSNSSVSVKETGAKIIGPNEDSPGSSLSGGAIAGIVILVLAIDVAIVFLLKKKTSKAPMPYDTLPRPFDEEI